MSNDEREADERLEQIALSLLQNLFGSHHPGNFRIRLWNGAIWEPEESEPAHFTLVLNHPGALRKMFLPGTELSLGEAYIYDDFDIEGNIESVFDLAESLATAGRSWWKRLLLGRQLLRLPADGGERLGRQAPDLTGKTHSQARDRSAISYHYDVSNAFYALWLDQRMVYSCGYFSSPDDDLNAAQEQKLDYICRKLRLKDGDRLLDIGCGWGGLVIHAAGHYGARAIGITLSEPQAELANARIREAGLSDRCSVEVRDYRDTDNVGGFDKLVSVGMFEHVGARLLLTYFQRAWRLLRPGGIFLNHGIASNVQTPAPRGKTFSEVYVFPDGELVPISRTLTAAERAGFEVRDVESLREHYALTLQNWVRRLECQYDDARQLTDEPTYRTWRLYMAGSAHGFITGRLNVYQSLLVKPDAGQSGFPLTRSDWYI